MEFIKAFDKATAASVPSGGGAATEWDSGMLHEWATMVSSPYPGCVVSHWNRQWTASPRSYHSVCYRPTHLTLTPKSLNRQKIPLSHWLLPDGLGRVLMRLVMGCLMTSCPIAPATPTSPGIYIIHNHLALTNPIPHPPSPHVPIEALMMTFPYPLHPCRYTVQDN